MKKNKFWNVLKKKGFALKNWNFHIFWKFNHFQTFWKNLPIFYTFLFSSVSEYDLFFQRFDRIHNIQFVLHILIETVRELICWHILVSEYASVPISRVRFWNYTENLQANKFCSCRSLLYWKMSWIRFSRLNIVYNYFCVRTSALIILE